MDKLKEKCGVFGIFNAQDSSALTALGLHALQHRGQEGCGIVSYDGKNFHSEKRQGLVGDNFTNKDVLKKLPGNFAIGHNRYSTTGETSLRNIQPFFADLHGGGIAIAHNGNLTNAISLRENLVKDGAWVLFIVFMLVGWRINTEWNRKQKKIDVHLESLKNARIESGIDTDLDLSQYRYQRTEYLREKYFHYIQFWLAIISVILIGILLKLD